MGIGRPTLVRDIRRHLKDGVLPADYVLPKQKPFLQQQMTEKTLRRKLRGVVCAVHRPDWARLRFNAAERRMFRIANAVPAETLCTPLKEAFLSRGKRLNFSALAGFVMQCLQSRDAVTAQCGLMLVTILPYPKPFMTQPVRGYEFGIMMRDADMLSKYEGFRALAGESMYYISGINDLERNPMFVSQKG